MGYIIGLLLTLTLSLHAEWITPTDWELAQDRAGVKIYVPKGENAQDAHEVFTVFQTPQPNRAIDPSSLEKMIGQLLPGYLVTVEAVDQEPQSTLFYWIAKAKEGTIYGLSRAFSEERGSALLTYQTDQESLLQVQKGGYLELLRKENFPVD